MSPRKKTQEPRNDLPPIPSGERVPVRSEFRELPHQLTVDEINHKVGELVDTFSQVTDEEAHQKEVKDQMKATMSGLRARQARLANEISSGQELRNVEVETFIGGDGTVAQEVRKDTGEILLSREPTEDELQMRLPLPPVPGEGDQGPDAPQE